MPENRPSTGPFIAALAGNSLIAAAKFVAAAFTGSSVMIAEGVHSIVDSTNNVLMLVGARRSDAKPSPEHPFGHGKELYFWSLIVALVIFSAGGGISIYEGITHVLHPSPVENPLWNYGVLGVSFVADGTTLVIAYREFKPHKGKRSLWRAIRVSKDPTKFAVVLEDGAATIGLFIAAIGLLATQLTGSGIYDGLVHRGRTAALRDSVRARSRVQEPAARRSSGAQGRRRPARDRVSRSRRRGRREPVDDAPRSLRPAAQRRRGVS